MTTLISSYPACSDLLSIIDRPTRADSACVVAYKNAVVETGYQYLQLLEQGHQQNFPQAQFRLGLPSNTELSVILPNDNLQSITPYNGSTATSVAVKKQISSTTGLVFAVESITTLPSGSDGFGSDGLGEAVNGIISYDATKSLNLSFMCGVTTATTSETAGGQRFQSFNPDLVITWGLSENFDVYGEVYGQSKTGPEQNSGFDYDAGILYLINKNLAADLEYGHRLSGVLNNLKSYVGAGLTIQL